MSKASLCINIHFVKNNEHQKYLNQLSIFFIPKLGAGKGMHIARYLFIYSFKFLFEIYFLDLSFGWHCISESALVSFRHQKACYYFPVLISFFSSGQHSWLLCTFTSTHTYIMCLLLSHVHCQLICPFSRRQYLYIRFVSGIGILWRRPNRETRVFLGARNTFKKGLSRKKIRIFK